MPDPPPYPIVVGVTGHRDIVSEAEEAVRVAVHAVLEGLKAEFGDALHVMTALADGADQLVAEEAEKLGLKTIAVSPMPFATYRATVANQDGLDHQWDRAVLKLVLPELCDPAEPGYNELHYEQLGALLSRRCHLLLALWDGLPPPWRRAALPRVAVPPTWCGCGGRANTMLPGSARARCSPAPARAWTSRTAARCCRW